MDKVFIKGLEVEGIIGIFQWEREVKQVISVDIEMEFDNKKEYIDPACCRGYGAYANHRPIHECNAKFKQRYPNKIEIIATKAIKNREEIFVNYGYKYRFN